MLALKIEKAKMEDLKEKNPDLYEECVALGQQNSSTEISELKAKITELENEKTKTEDIEKIQTVAKNLGLEEKGEELIKEGTPLNEALATLALSAKDVRQETLQAFRDTTPETAGDGHVDHLDLEVKTQKDAMEVSRKKHNCTKNEAWEFAKVEYPNLFNAQLKTITGE